MKQHANRERGVTLIELLIVIAILSLVLAGIYGLMDTAHKSYLKTRALVESQQTSRVVMNYLTYRLREVDGGGSGSIGVDPRQCTDCHIPNLDQNASDDIHIPCEKDVLVPRKNIYIDDLSTASGLPDLTTVDAGHKIPAGNNSITFWADLLPKHGLADTFTDSPYSKDGKWTLVKDKGTTGEYDADKGDREILYYDFNDNGDYDYYAEKWTLKLRKPADQPYYELIESLSFGDFADNVSSGYLPYTDEPVAYGITALDIQRVPWYIDKADFNTQFTGSATGGGGVDSACKDCHDSSPKGAAPNVFGSDDDFNFDQFISTHSWWNTKALTVELVTVDPMGHKYMRSKQYIIPRNIEVNMQKIQ